MTPGSGYAENVLYPAQSIYGGTWNSGPGPVEIQWAELMREHGWSWAEYEATPLYVRRVCWDLLNARREAEEQRAANRGG